ncbi:hypothetical protein MKW92_014467, partial [Papaver armeniacum]
EEGGTSTSPCFSEQPILIPPDFEHDWRYGKYVVDSEGYSIKVNHFSDDEVSEEECDSDDDDDKKNKKSTLPAALKSSDKSHLEETEDREYIPIPIPVPPHDSKGVCLITFDGFHKEGTNGGYGAMLRHGNGTPIAAVAGGSEHSISAYYHTLEGLKSGLEAAQMFGIKSLYLVCNSERVCLTVRGAFISLDEGDCGYHPPESFKVVCHPCLQGKLSMNEPFDSVLEIMTDILTIGKCYYRSNGMVKAHVKEWNKPADYLAKLVRNPGEHKIFQPDELPDDLLTLLNEHGGRIPMIIK